LPMGGMGARFTFIDKKWIPSGTAIPSTTLRTGLAVFSRAGSPCHVVENNLPTKMNRTRGMGREHRMLNPCCCAKKRAKTAIRVSVTRLGPYSRRDRRGISQGRPPILFIPPLQYNQLHMETIHEPFNNRQGRIFRGTGYRLVLFLLSLPSSEKEESS
jgi:hypothetical protein